MQRIEPVFRAFLALFVVVSSFGSARGQCMDWGKDFGPVGINGTVRALAEFDDGSGTALFVGGAFDANGDVATRGIAKWDGATWSPVGAGINGSVYTLLVFDDGSGPALYAGGTFTIAGAGAAPRVARWNGTAWSPLGSGVSGPVNAMTVFDDGSGPALVVAGVFSVAGGTSARYVAKWNGASWSALGSGLNAQVFALAVFDDGSGPALYAGSDFQTPGVVLSKWNGATWSAVGNPVNGYVAALQVFDDGSGSALYAAGAFVTVGGMSANRIARWNGSAWSAVGAGLSNTVNALSVFDEGSGPELWAGGYFTEADGAPAAHVAKWNGGAWSALGAGVSDTVHAFGALGSAMHVGGSSSASGSGSPLAPSLLARWNGSTWTRTQNRGEGLNETVLTLLAHDDGSGPSLFAGGKFTSAGTTTCNRIARWDGAHWHPLGTGLTGGAGGGGVEALTLFDDGGGPALYAGGDFRIAGGVNASGIARWNGTSWSAVGAGIGGSSVAGVDALAVFDDGSGPALYAGGTFTTAGGAPASYIAKWDGANWSALGAGMSSSVHSLAVFDDGGGAALYAGGTFDNAGGMLVKEIAKWDGVNWSSLGVGMGGVTYPRVEALAVFDDGFGPALYVGGAFHTAGGMSALRIAKWDGSNWSPLGTGAAGPISPTWVDALTVFDDGAGPALYACGPFTSMNGVSANFVAKFDGSSWSPLGSGITSYSESYEVAGALAAYDDGTGGGPELYVGGSMLAVGAIASRSIARFGACEPGLGYCFGDGLDQAVTTDCPCGNFGSSGHGCANFFFASGAQLTALGTTSPNTVVFTCNDVPNNTLCTFLRGANNVATGFVFADGVRCVNPPLLRFGQQQSGQNGNPQYTVASGVIADAPGTTRFYQCQYRNPTAGYCDPGLFNVSNGYKLVW